MCSDTANYTDGNQFESNLDRVLYRALYNDGSDSIFSSKTEGEEPDKVYGLFLCRGDVSAADCQKCINVASQAILKACPFKKEAIIWYDPCMIRYSNRSFFSTVETQPAECLLNAQNVTEPAKFTEILDNMFANLTSFATIPSNRMYAANEADVGNSTKLHVPVKKEGEFSHQAATYGHYKKIGIGYELYPFLADPPVAAAAPSAIGTDVIGGPSGLLCSGIYYQRRRKRTAEEGRENNQEVQLLDLAQGRIVDDYSTDNLQGENPTKSHDFPSIQLDLILVATKHFSQENKLGEGGFGPVYKSSPIASVVSGNEMTFSDVSSR
ncbi:hypothetical protein Vadar_030025 [Vaccinium darrowii]|uniref:Uncharacterized protein n=1 Tax=Vaccinium darrowii TaxID=229202 RepID=A0ACB7XD78_9ERIC|nr:hypothetical protein Vadar_030025 [Vaccinium darrowii]